MDNNQNLECKEKPAKIFLIFIIGILILAIIVFCKTIIDAKANNNPLPITDSNEILVKTENPRQNNFTFPVMTFTEEEAESLIQRFADERAQAEAEARAKAEAEAKAKAEAEAKAKAEAEAAERAKLAKSQVAKMNYGDNEVFMLAVIIGQETGGENEEIMLAVGNVVLNRIADPRFPNNMYDVLTGKNQYGRESGNFYFNSYVTSEAQERCYAIARRLLDGERVLPANVVWQAGFPQGNGTYAYYDTKPFGLWLCY